MYFEYIALYPYISSAHTSLTTPDHSSKYRTIIASKISARSENEGKRRRHQPTRESTKNMNLNINFVNKWFFFLLLFFWVVKTMISFFHSINESFKHLKFKSDFNIFLTSLLLLLLCSLFFVACSIWHIFSHFFSNTRREYRAVMFFCLDREINVCININMIIFQPETRKQEKILFWTECCSF